MMARSSLLYKLRQLKKQGNLYKFGSDENGNIWIQANEWAKKESDPTLQPGGNLSHSDQRWAYETAWK